MDKVEYVNPKDVQGLNLYAYCNNNPVMYYDPSGRFIIFAEALAIATIALIAFVAIVTIAALVDAKNAKKEYEENAI